MQFKVVSGDEILRSHLESGAGNAHYTSNTAQTDIIDSIGCIILKSVVEEVNFSRYFSVLADETTDAAGHEQLTVVIRYIFEGQIKKQFIRFMTMNDQSWDRFAKQILSILRQSGINVDKIIDQGYDGASAMSGQFRGV